MDNKNKYEYKPPTDADNKASEPAKEEAAAEAVTAETKAAAEAVKFDSETVVDELGVVSKNTKIIGDIITGGHLAVYGEVQGNITAKGNVFANGKINGDIACDNLKRAGCNLKTNLTVKNNITIADDTQVEGTISGGKIMVDGIVKGDINASESVDIYANAKVVGDIETKALGIESGAELQGRINVVK